MTTLATVRADLASAITTTGLRCSAYLQDAVNAPCAMVSRGDFDPRLILGGSKSAYPFTVHVFVPRAAERQSQQTLDLCAATTGTQSLTLAIQNGALWTTSTIDYASVVEVGGEAIVEVAGVQYIGIQIQVEVVY